MCQRNHIFSEKNGYTNVQIAGIVSRHPNTISRIINANKRNIVRGRTGRRKTWSVRDKYRLIIFMKRNRRAPPKKLFELFNRGNVSPVSLSTIRRRVKELGYVYRVPRKINTVRALNRKIWQKWCTARARKTLSFWKRWIFTDESMVELGKEGKIRVWRKTDEKFNHNHCWSKEQKKIKLMIWGGITYSGIRVLVPISGTLDSFGYMKILSDNLPTLIRGVVGVSAVLQQDNAPVHTARAVRTFLQQNSVNTTIWPAQSPDLNIIENVWKMVKERIWKESAVIKTKQELWEVVQKHWLDLDSKIFKKLYNSIPKRLKTVIRMKGYISKY